MSHLGIAILYFLLEDALHCEKSYMNQEIFFGLFGEKEKTEQKVSASSHVYHVIACKISMSV